MSGPDLDELIASVATSDAARAAFEADVERQVYDVIDLDPEVQLAVGRAAHPDIRRCVVSEHLDGMDLMQAGAIRALAGESLTARVKWAIHEEISGAFEEGREPRLDEESITARAFGGPA